MASTVKSKMRWCQDKSLLLGQEELFYIGLVLKFKRERLEIYFQMLLDQKFDLHFINLWYFLSLQQIEEGLSIWLLFP